MCIRDRLNSFFLSVVVVVEKSFFLVLYNMQWILLEITKWRGAGGSVNVLLKVQVSPSGDLTDLLCSTAVT